MQLPGYRDGLELVTFSAALLFSSFPIHFRVFGNWATVKKGQRQRQMPPGIHLRLAVAASTTKLGGGVEKRNSG